MLQIGDMVKYRWLSDTYGIVVGYGPTKHPITYRIDWFKHDSPVWIYSSYSSVDIVKVINV